MYLIAGLGNPGKEYSGTRHNIGFEVIDALAQKYNIDVNEKKFKGLMGKGQIEGHKVILIKPQTYMNLSGECIRGFLDYYKEDEKSKMLILYDDISLPPGQLRIRKNGSAGGHNGIKDIIRHLGHQDFFRVKIGVGEKPRGWDLADYVLGRFQKEEIEIMKDAVEDSTKAVAWILEKGMDSAMNQFNKAKE